MSLRNRFGDLAKSGKEVNLNLNRLKVFEDITYDICLVHRHIPGYQEKIDWLETNAAVLV
jgi:hypothetical protein